MAPRRRFILRFDDVAFSPLIVHTPLFAMPDAFSIRRLPRYFLPMRLLCRRLCSAAADAVSPPLPDSPAATAASAAALTPFRRFRQRRLPAFTRHY